MKPWYHHPWTWYLAGVLGFALVSGVALVLIATWQADEVVVADYYRQGLAINQDLASQQWAKTLKIQALLQTKNNQLIVQLNQPARELQLQLLSNRGSDFDQSYTLNQQSPDWHDLSWVKTPPEQVTLRLQGISQDRPWVIEQKIRWPVERLSLQANDVTE